MRQAEFLAAEFQPGASNGLTYIDGLSVDGHPTAPTFLSGSFIRTGGGYPVSAIRRPQNGLGHC